MLNPDVKQSTRMSKFRRLLARRWSELFRRYTGLFSLFIYVFLNAVLNIWLLSLGHKH